MRDRVMVCKDKVILQVISSTTIGGNGPAAGLIMNYKQCLELIKELIRAAGEAKKQAPAQHDNTSIVRQTLSDKY